MVVGSPLRSGPACVQYVRVKSRRAASSGDSWGDTGGGAAGAVFSSRDAHPYRRMCAWTHTHLPLAALSSFAANSKEARGNLRRGGWAAASHKPVPASAPTLKSPARRKPPLRCIPAPSCPLQVALSVTRATWPGMKDGGSDGRGAGVA